MFLDDIQGSISDMLSFVVLNDSSFYFFKWFVEFQILLFVVFRIFAG